MTPGEGSHISTKPWPTKGHYGQPLAIAVAPDVMTAYVADGAHSTVTPIDLGTSKPEKPVKTGSGWDSGFEAIVTVP